MHEQLAVQGCEVLSGNADQFAALIKSDTLKWAKIVKDSGATLD